MVGYLVLVLNVRLNEKVCRMFNPYNVDLSQENIDVIQKNNTILLSYGIACHFDKPYHRECRGHIWHYDGISWKRFSRPYDKFWNLHESKCVLKLEEEYVLINGNKYSYEDIYLTPKEDGTCIQLYYDYEIGKWIPNTLGTLHVSNIFNVGITFQELFWKLSKEKYGISESLINETFNKDNTYLFEICADVNRIVTRYSTDRIYFVTSRNISDGHYLTSNEFSNEKPLLMTYHQITRFKVNNKNELMKLLKQYENDNDDKKFPEGFVVCANNGECIAKIKNEKYILYHGVLSGDPVFKRKQIVRLFFQNGLDDIPPEFFNEQDEAFVQRLKTYVNSLILEIEQKIQEKESKVFNTRKDYALWVTANIPSQVNGYFFQGCQGSFKDWLKERVEKNIDTYIYL